MVDRRVTLGREILGNKEYAAAARPEASMNFR